MNRATTPCEENLFCPAHLDFIKGRSETPCSEHRTHPDDWFHDPGSGRDTDAGRGRRRALQACWADCPLKSRLLCLGRAIEEEHLDHGIWGGYTEAERREIVAERDRKREARGE